jgi:hypothetical protein
VGFFGSLFGGDQRKDLKRAKAKSDAALQSGYDEAQPFYDEAVGMFEPYAQSGQQANERYNQLLGLGTTEERDAAQQVYQSDPAFQGMLGLESNRLLKQLNARGKTYGGTAALAGARVGLEGYNGYLNRLQGQGAQGLGATGAQSAIRAGQGDLRYGLGATQAGQDTSFGNAMAESRNTGINNLLSIAGTAAKAYAASDIRFKRDIIRLGETDAGLPVYEFRYLWSDQPHIGVMAHEAEKMFPDAVMRNDEGYGFVNYSRIG